MNNNKTFRNRTDNHYYLLLEEGLKEGMVFTFKAKRLADGKEVEVKSKETFDEQFEQVPLLDTLYEFFDAQWIGNANLEKMTIALLQEASEALNELDWKPWKKVEPNLQAYREELADIGIFLLLTSKLAGMNLDDLFIQMYEKHLYNLTRKDHNRNSKK